MTESNEKSKNKSEKEKLYLMSAIAVFEAKGYNNARVKDITDKAGTSVGNFYRYFESKEKIFETIIAQFNVLMLENLKALQEYDIPPIPAIKDLFRSYLKIFKDKRKIALIFIEQMGGINKKFKKMKNKFMEEFVKEAENLIRPLVEKGYAREQDAQMASVMWVATILETFHWWVRNVYTKKEDEDGKQKKDYSVEEEELVDNLTQFLVRGIMK